MFKNGGCIFKKQKLIEHLQTKYHISNQRVLQAILNVPREKFVEAPFRFKAYEDTSLPIGFGQTISKPSTVALMTELLELSGGEKILEIGMGSGYQAAILAELKCRVFTIERVKGLFDRASKILKELGYYNVIPLFADGSKGWPSEAPFDRIIITAAANELEEILFAQLSNGGILIGPRQEQGKQVITRFRRINNEIHEEDITDAHFVPLLQGRML
ncbi:MAG: protein-L-isoaspartate(D-aspartate) O-methyltransferase [Calditrichia bacterium]